MVLPDGAGWSSLPGGYDRVNARRLWPASNAWGLPDLRQDSRLVPDELIGYRTRVDRRFPDGVPARVGLHFFVHDYRFETAFYRPDKAWQYVRRFRTVLTPDYSVTPDMPRALALWQVYRARWCGALWSARGRHVIPSVQWGGVDSFDFVFAGLPRGAVVAVGSVGVFAGDQAVIDGFRRGWSAMLLALDPAVVLVYGDLPDDLRSTADVRMYDPITWRGGV